MTSGSKDRGAQTERERKEEKATRGTLLGETGREDEGGKEEDSLNPST